MPGLVFEASDSELGPVGPRQNGGRQALSRHVDSQGLLDEIEDIVSTAKVGRIATIRSRTVEP